MNECKLQGHTNIKGLTNYTREKKIGIILKRHYNDTRCMKDYTEMPLSDPQRIPPTVAVSDPPSTSELVAMHKTRFSSKQNEL